MEHPALLELSKRDDFSKDHVNYLKHLKETGFEPKVIYDIGSCVLHWTKKAKELWPDARFILFEAMHEAEFLYKGYDYHMGILCDEDNKELKFYKNVEMPTGNSYYREIGCEISAALFPPDKYDVQQGMTLDTIVKQRWFPPPDLIKIDVQGAEQDIIRGGLTTMLNTTILIVEMQHTNYNLDAPHIEQTGPYIESLGFTCIAPQFSSTFADADYAYINTKKNSLKA